ncbi:MAG: hypothetical protein ACOYM8_07190 [Caulobacterales bacterium]|jgi:hypothetical protein
MVLITPTAFLAAATGLIRFGSTAWDGYRDWLRKTDLRVYLPANVEPDPKSVEDLAVQIAFDVPAWRGPGGDLERLWVPGAQRFYDLNTEAPDHLILVRMALRLVSENVWKKGPVEGAPAAVSREPTSVLLTHRAWLTQNDQSLWGRLGLDIAQTAISILGAQPSLVGLRGQAEKLVGGIALNLSATLRDDGLNVPREAFAQRALSLVFRSTLTTITENPELALRDEHWAPVVAAFVGPLKAEVEKDQSLAPLALDRLETLLRGPMALGAFKAISEHADSVLTGRAGADSRTGAVLRELLTDVVARGGGDGDVLRVFGDAGVGGLVRTSLLAVQKRPELFVRTKGANADVTKGFAANLAGVLAKASPPFDRNAALGPQIAGVALDSAAILVGRRLVAQSGTTPWCATAADAGVKVVEAIFLGFKNAVADPRDGRDLFQGVFDRELAIDILKLTADHIAKTPAMVTGTGVSEEATSLATGLAKLVAEDQTSLLHAEDWRKVIAASLDLAARNPKALFGASATPSPETETGLALARMLFATANEQFRLAPRTSGSVMFGATLRDALVTTFQASATVVLGLQSPQEQQSRITALGDFVRRLNAAAAGPDETMRMGADEWLYVYRRFAAHLLDKGAAATISDDMIRDTLMGLDARGAK